MIGIGSRLAWSVDVATLQARSGLEPTRHNLMCQRSTGRTMARLSAAMTKRQDNPHLIRQRPAIVPGFLCPRGHAPEA
jgi:hypothetical protein